MWLSIRPELPHGVKQRVNSNHPAVPFLIQDSVAYRPRCPNGQLISSSHSPERDRQSLLRTMIRARRYSAKRDSRNDYRSAIDSADKLKGYHMQPCVTNGSQLVTSLDTTERGQLATCSLAEAGVETGVNILRTL